MGGTQSSLVEEKMSLSNGLSNGKESVTRYWASPETTSTSAFLITTLASQLLLTIVVA